MENCSAVGFLVSFPLLWCGVSFMLARIGGWSSLAARYRTDNRPEGKAFYMQGGRIGMVIYSACLTIHVTEGGMYLAVFPLYRIGHPCLFIPWTEFNNLRQTRSMFCDFVQASVGKPRIAKVLLRPCVFPPEFLESELGKSSG
jgi:hypothetical protein